MFRVDLVGVPDPGEPARPVLKGHRAVWDIPFIPVWQTVEEGTLGLFREAAAAGDGPLALPFASHQARGLVGHRNNHGHLARQRAGRGTQTDCCDPVPRPVAARTPRAPQGGPRETEAMGDHMKTCPDPCGRLGGFGVIRWWGLVWDLYTKLTNLSQL